MRYRIESKVRVGNRDLEVESAIEAVSLVDAIARMNFQNGFESLLSAVYIYTDVGMGYAYWLRLEDDTVAEASAQYKDEMVIVAGILAEVIAEEKNEFTGPDAAPGFPS